MTFNPLPSKPFYKYLVCNEYDKAFQKEIKGVYDNLVHEEINNPSYKIGEKVTLEMLPRIKDSSNKRTKMTNTLKDFSKKIKLHLKDMEKHGKEKKKFFNVKEQAKGYLIAVKEIKKKAPYLTHTDYTHCGRAPVERHGGLDVTAKRRRPRLQARLGRAGLER